MKELKNVFDKVKRAFLSREKAWEESKNHKEESDLHRSETVSQHHQIKIR